MIHVIDDWYIQSDGKQYIVGRMKPRKNKPSEANFVRPTYHSSIVSCVQRVVRERKHEKVSKGTIELKEALELLINEQNRFEEFLKSALCNE